MRTHRFGCTVLSALAVLTAGCGSGSGADGDTVAWTDGVCSALNGFTVAATQLPRIDQADPRAAVLGVDGYLATTSDALRQSVEALDQVGPSPVDGGDEYAGRLREALVSIRASFEAARTQLVGVDASSPEVLASALPAAMAPLQELRTIPSPTEGLAANEELRTASEQAPSCQDLRSVSSPAG